MIKEPLDKSAPLAKEAASRLCGMDSVSGSDCAWYHGTWQYLRLLGVITTLDKHAPLFIDALRALARAGDSRRVLISGSADYALLALALSAFNEENVAADITVIDRCQTPLLLCRWYADILSTSIETRQTSVLDYQNEQGFDIIFTHSFLGFFSKDQRPALFAKWRQLLRPGGKLLLANGIKPADGDAPVYFTQDEANAFTERTLEKAKRMDGQLDLSQDALRNLAQTFAENIFGYAVTSRQELTTLLEDAGFEIDTADFGDLGISSEHHPTGPTGVDTVTNKNEYAWLVASRR